MTRVKQLYARYGASFIVAYLGLFALSMIGFSIAIQAGFEVEGAQEGAGLLVAAWLGTKLLQPLRIAGSVALAPLVARLLGKRFPDADETENADAPAEAAAAPESDTAA